MTVDIGIGQFGIWTGALGNANPAEIRSVASELQDLGFTALWIPEAFWADPFLIASHALDATDSLIVATGIASIYARTARAMSNAADTLGSWHRNRFLLGLGVSHQRTVETAHRGDYSHPLATMREYLDDLDRNPTPGIPPPRLLAALGPKMVRLAGERTSGVHSYNVPASHTAFVRGDLGPDRLVAPEVKIVFETDPDVARGIARENLPLSLPNYANPLVRLGFDREAVERSDDAVVDAIVGWGTPDQIRTHVQAHLDAGADHIAIQVLNADRRPPLEDWRRLSRLLS